jgi:hypothetical protein
MNFCTGVQNHIQRNPYNIMYLQTNGYACDYKVTSLVKLKHTHASMQQTSKFKHMEKIDEQITILSSKIETRNTAGAAMIALCSAPESFHSGLHYVTYINSTKSKYMVMIILHRKDPEKRPMMIYTKPF